MAVALYYSSQLYNTKDMFTELSIAWGVEPVKVRLIGDLVEFGSEQMLNFMVNEGSWKHKGYALIFVRYDGFSKLSNMIILNLPVWTRIYDIPVGMMTSFFIRALGNKVGLVLEIGESIKDFKRVKINFPLADPLKKSIPIKVKSCGVMEFVVKYEGVPLFCFNCGHIGHAMRE
ncbi:uncharacterized protein [Miscanthus floridulus]|uniref:uncharacterized protein n=1 Tax=Miscanthus floridulus TaxID=154761 RepID=UPI003458F689